MEQQRWQTVVQNEATLIQRTSSLEQQMRVYQLDKDKLQNEMELIHKAHQNDMN